MTSPDVLDRIAAAAGVHGRGVHRCDADMWALWEAGAWAVVPTNTQRRNDGTAIMGAGVARAAADRVPGLDSRYGRQLAAGNVNVAFADQRIVCIPTKHQWRNPTTTAMFDDAVAAVDRWIGGRPEPVAVAIPALGAGRGGLNPAWVLDELTIRLAHHDRHLIILCAPPT